MARHDKSSQAMINGANYSQIITNKSQPLTRVAFGPDPHVKADQDCILVNFFKDSLYKELLGSMGHAHDERISKLQS